MIIFCVSLRVFCSLGGVMVGEWLVVLLGVFFIVVVVGFSEAPETTFYDVHSYLTKA